MKAARHHVSIAGEHHEVPPSAAVGAVEKPRDPDEALAPADVELDRRATGEGTRELMQVLLRAVYAARANVDPAESGAAI